MILRRITAAFQRQDWFTVGIETLIVVLGVFLGLQANNWNEARKDRADAREYRERLITDMQLSVSRNKTQIEYARRQIEQLDLVVSALTTCHLDADKAGVFDIGLYNMGKVDLPTMVMGTIDELNATGDFKLIGSPALRRAISDTVRKYRTVFAIEPQLTGRIVPNVNYVRSRVRFMVDENIDMPRTIDPDKAFYNFKDLCSDEKFINAVAAVREATQAVIFLNRQVMDRQNKLLTELKGTGK